MRVARRLSIGIVAALVVVPAVTLFAVQPASAATFAPPTVGSPGSLIGDVMDTVGGLTAPELAALETSWEIPAAQVGTVEGLAALTGDVGAGLAASGTLAMSVAGSLVGVGAAGIGIIIGGAVDTAGVVHATTQTMDRNLCISTALVDGYPTSICASSTFSPTANPDADQAVGLAPAASLCDSSGGCFSAGGSTVYTVPSGGCLAGGGWAVGNHPPAIAVQNHLVQGWGAVQAHYGGSWHTLGSACPAGSAGWGPVSVSTGQVLVWGSSSVGPQYPDSWRLTASTGVTVTQPVSVPDPPRTTQLCATFATGAPVCGAASAPSTEAQGLTAPPSVPLTPIQAGQVTGWKVTEHDTSLGAPDKVLFNAPVAPSLPGIAANQPDCLVQHCALQVARILGTGTKLCTVGDDCKDWFYDAHKADDFECVYGPSSSPKEYVLDLSECNTLAPSYDPDLVGSPNPVANPQTGDQPAQATSTSTSPDTDAQPGSASQPGAQSDACFPSGWAALNPIEWVEKPVECAFVPDPSAVTAVEAQIGGAWGASAPERIVNVAIPAYVVPNFDASGCAGPEVAITINFWQNFGGALSWLSSVPAVVYDGHPLSACADPLATLALWSRVLSGIALTWFGGLAVMRQIGGIVGSRGVGGGGEA